MVAKFLDHNNSEFLQQQKSNKFRMAKEQQFAHASSFVVHFLAVAARLQHEPSKFHLLALSSR